jgi:hypothetical protein
MSKIKVVLLGLFAVFALGATMAATASAATHAFKIEGTEIAKGVEETLEDDSFSGKMETTIAGLSISVQCEEDISTGTIGEGGKSKGSIEFKNCFVIETNKGKRVFLTSCTVTEPVKAKFTDQLIEHSVDEYKGEGGEETFVELEIGVCAIKGKYKVKGSQLCAVPESEFEKVIHESICTPSGSKLKQRITEENGAQLFGVEQIKLKSAKNWSAN